MYDRCINGGVVLNHLMYADDLVLFTPYSAGLQQLLSLCSEFRTENDICYNATKSSVMIQGPVSLSARKFTSSNPM